ncbi:hypothetical protein [Spongiivirga citrea]|uniref:Uncharacterized protein n=1 Tax=Spongiivirga citrea TaxID=1481457 RepID=A0A6M0CT92_9FLAO|nr:hypothetical protein [Spongiivirga citrea]NER17020.1 hypothetical protein [Spongiivirga citrea]
MKIKRLKDPLFLLVVALSFFLGRESKELNLFNDNEPPHNANIRAVIPNNVDNSYFTIPLESIKDSVYRCGKSKVYHPTLKHGAFKICKSKVTKLTQEKAIEQGLRHCKCPGSKIKVKQK